MEKLPGRKWFEIGGIVASVVLIGVAILWIVMGFLGRSDVHSTLRQEKIIGTDDSSIAGQLVDTGSEAREFSKVMRRHTLEITGDRTYAELGRYLDADGKETNDPAKAAKDPKSGQPVQNQLRNTWVTQRALATGLEMAFFAERVSLFSIAIGFALLLVGIGLLVLTLGGALRQREATASAPPADIT